MSTRDPKRPEPVPPPADAGKPSSSGRVRFDDRGQAIWEWQLQTGHFDKNATSGKVKALTDNDLSLAESPVTPPLTIDIKAGVNPYETIPDKPKPVDPAGGGGDPYARGPTKNPQKVSYNPYERPPPKKPGR